MPRITIRRARALLALPALLAARVARIWKHDFRDVRLILEHEGDVHYFHLTPRVQRLVSRGSLTALGTVATAFVVFQLNTLRLSMRVSELEHTQSQIGQALAIVETTAVASPEEVRVLAERIRSRQDELMRLVETLSSSLTAENAQLWQELQLAGLDRDLFDQMRQSLPAGGPPVPPGLAVTEGSALPEELASNIELKEVLRTLPSRLPLADAEVSSKYGLRRHPVIGGLDKHEGLDLISQSNDDTVRAVRAGRVRVAGNSGGYGRLVVVTHASGVETWYAHLASIAVRPGQTVNDRTMLGMVGNTGLSTGKHLHFEVRVDGVSLNPDWVVRATRHVQ